MSRRALVSTSFTRPVRRPSTSLVAFTAAPAAVPATAAVRPASTAERPAASALASTTPIRVSFWRVRSCVVSTDVLSVSTFELPTSVRTNFFVAHAGATTIVNPSTPPHRHFSAWLSSFLTGLFRGVARRVASERERERPHADGRSDLVVLQYFFGRDACAVHVGHVVLVRLDDDALELESGKQTFAAGVREDLSMELQVGCYSGLPTDGPGGHRRVAAQRELIREQAVQAVLVHEEHHEVR